MNWTPICEEDLLGLVSDEEGQMQPAAQNLWLLVKIQPHKWASHPRGDEGGGFWAVGILGQQVIWYDDIENEFCMNRYDRHGEITSYPYSFGTLRDLTRYLLFELELGHFEPDQRTRVRHQLLGLQKKQKKDK